MIGSGYYDKEAETERMKILYNIKNSSKILISARENGNSMNDNHNNENELENGNYLDSVKLSEWQVPNCCSAFGSISVNSKSVAIEKNEMLQDWRNREVEKYFKILEEKQNKININLLPQVIYTK